METNSEIIERLKNIEKMLRMLLVKEPVDHNQRQIDPPSLQQVAPMWKNNEYMRPDGIAEELGMDASTIRRWLREGEIPYSKFGRAVRVKTKDFVEYLNKSDIR